MVTAPRAVGKAEFGGFRHLLVLYRGSIVDEHLACLPLRQILPEPNVGHLNQVGVRVHELDPAPLAVEIADEGAVVETGREYLQPVVGAEYPVLDRLEGVVEVVAKLQVGFAGQIGRLALVGGRELP